MILALEGEGVDGGRGARIMVERSSFYVLPNGFRDSNKKGERVVVAVS